MGSLFEKFRNNNIFIVEVVRGNVDLGILRNMNNAVVVACCSNIIR